MNKPPREKKEGREEKYSREDRKESAKVSVYKTFAVGKGLCHGLKNHW